MRARLPIIASLCVAILILLSRTAWPVALAQTPPTKTPIGQPPTKTAIPNSLPTKPPVATSTVANPTSTPGVLPTKTSFPTFTTVPPQAAASPTPPPPAALPLSGALAVSATFTPLPLAGVPLPIVSPSPIAPTPTLSADPVPPLSNGNVPDPPVAIITAPPVSPVVTQVVNLSGLILGLVALGVFIWFGLMQVGRMITREIRTVSLANLRLQYEADRIARQDKLVFRSDADVIRLLEQAILDASGLIVQLQLTASGLLLSPPLLAVTDPDHTRYLFSPVAPPQLRALQRRHRLAQFVIGRAGRLESYPLDALNSTPFIADDLRSALEYLAVRYQVQRRPLPRSDRWYLYVARPQPAHGGWPGLPDSVTSRLKRVTIGWRPGAGSAVREAPSDPATKKAIDPMPYTTLDQALRVTSALSAVATGCCLRYGVFAQVRRQRPPDDQLDVEVIDPATAFYTFYDLYRTLVISNDEDMTQPVESWLVCRVAVPEPAEHYFLRGFSRWSVEWVEVVYPGAEMVLTDPALLALQTIEGLREDSLDASAQPGAVRLSAQPGTVSLDLVARQYARAKAGLGSESLRQALHKWGAHLGPDHLF